MVRRAHRDSDKLRRGIKNSNNGDGWYSMFENTFQWFYQSLYIKKELYLRNLKELRDGTMEDKSTSSLIFMPLETDNYLEVEFNWINVILSVHSLPGQWKEILRNKCKIKILKELHVKQRIKGIGKWTKIFKYIPFMINKITTSKDK